MFESISQGISQLFSDVMPHTFCVGCVLTGLVESAAIGFAALAAIAAAPAWLAIGLTVGLLALGAYGAAQLYRNWGRMSDKEKSKALGGIVGGLVTGFGGPKILPTSVPIPGIQLLTTPEGFTIPVLTTTAAPAAVAGSAAGLGGAGTVAMMSGGEGTGGANTTDDYVNNNPKATEDETQIGRLLNDKAKSGDLSGITKVEGAPESNIPGQRSADYRITQTDGSVESADLYQPTSSNPKSISSNIIEKSGQANTVVVELGKGGSSAISDADAQTMADNVVNTPGHSVDRVIVVRNGQIITDSSRP